MGEVLTAGAIMLGIASFFGALLALADRYLKVEEDPRVGHVTAMLPGSNCGACGQPGCRAFAESVVSGSVKPGKCSVSTRDGVEQIARYLGVDAGHEEKRVARLRCAGGRSVVQQLADYHGWSSCRAAFVVNGGGKACAWGCLGLADCERACTFAAIAMSADGLPVVDVDRCTACGDCVTGCPLDLFVLEPLAKKVLVQCNSPLTGDAARALCRVACDACGRCAADAPPGAIEMAGGLPVIHDPARLERSCTYRCPTGAIQWVERRQFGAIPR